MVPVLAVAGCSATPPALPPESEAARCGAVWRAIDAAVDGAGTGDAAAQPVAGYPFLRADRFLASFSGTVDGTERRVAWIAWIGRMAALGRDAAAVEIANLPAPVRARLDDFSNAAVGVSTLAAVAHCSPILSRTVAYAPLDVAVDDHYSDLQRLVGLYPLTAAAVAFGYDRWRVANLPAFRSAPPFEGTPVVYGPANGAGALEAVEVARSLQRARANPLAIPDPDPALARRLVAAYAPIWIVDTAGPDDRIGTITRAGVETIGPTVYHRLSWTRWGGEILLQINYFAWFPGRTGDAPLDLLAGRYDSVIWRVTLGSDGRPLIYDSIHGCGCYHLFFPVPPLTPHATFAPHDIRERAETPAPGPRLEAGQRITLRLAAGSHYLQGVSASDGPSTTASYPLRPAADLRTIEQADGGTRSLYDPDGLVAGSERLERILLWPMGIASPGAMRQWGTHATAFIGRRHFDDPYLIENNFKIITNQ